MVLEEYSDAVIADITNPHTGLQRRCKFAPSIQEVIEACEQESARHERLKRATIAQPLTYTEDRRPGRRANVFVADHLPQYQKLLAMAKSPDADPADWRWDETRPGIWVSLGWMNGIGPKVEKVWKSATDDELRARYGVRTDKREAAE